ncbi:hypothetical protein QTP70_019988 [Hemibagrus guttatus]|uniref:Ig-like domain-containing protein n=1 Tax=Hemibagrus guttatus TaxID=175788 RepID=A0AAE0R739_9TELE|nr:hypothetical protein QTP70_019988 [Hemibagrus guttatus]
MFYRGTMESILSSCITAWFGNCTVSDHKTLQQIVRTAEKMNRDSLPSIMDIYTTCCIHKANSIVYNPTHPSHTLFSLLPFRKRYRSIRPSQPYCVTVSSLKTSASSTLKESKLKPTVRVNPQSSVYTGDTVTLSCELQQGTGWEFHWYKNNQWLWSLNSKQAKTLKVTVDNAGETEYQCRARKRNYYTSNYRYLYTEFSDPVKITARASINPDNQFFSGDTVTLRCDIQDEIVSSWQYSWYKDASHSPVSRKQVYRISGVEVTNKGKYTCRRAYTLLTLQ